MPITVIGKPGDITFLVDRFSSAYHRDFDRVRKLGQTYLNSKPSNGSARRLAHKLRQALDNWGAGRRKAPVQQSVTRISSCLASPGVHGALVALQMAASSGLGIRGGRRTLKRTQFGGHSVSSFDRHLFEALRRLAAGLFVGCSNVTYPMKAVLLITGLMPAFDSQVRRGLRRAGLSGMSSTQYLLPNARTGVNWLKISRLPFLLGESHKACRRRIRSEMELSLHPTLNSDAGRIFDVLLFMQADPANPLVITLSGGSHPWYDIP